MPRFLFEAEVASSVDDAIEGAAIRNPEVAVEQRWTDHDGGGREVFVCSAPAAEHVERWAAAAGLVLRDLRAVHPHTEPTDRPRRGGN